MAVSISGDGAVTGVASVETPTTLSGLTIPTLGFGKVLQVVSNTSTTSETNSTTTYAEILNVSITPSSTSSRIFVVAHCRLESIGSSNSYSGIAILENGSAVVNTDAGLSGSTTIVYPHSCFTLRSPNTTSAITYGLGIRKGSAGTTSVSTGSVIRSIVAFEIAA